MFPYLEIRSFKTHFEGSPRTWPVAGHGTPNSHFGLRTALLPFSRSVLSDSFWDPRNCSPPGSSAHGVFQARALQWAPVPSPSLMLTTAKSPWQTMLPWANHLTSEPPFSHLWNGTKTSTSLTEYETRWKLKALEVPRSPWKKSTATGQQQLWETAFQPSHLIHFKS